MLIGFSCNADLKYFTKKIIIILLLGNFMLLEYV